MCAVQPSSGQQNSERDACLCRRLLPDRTVTFLSTSVQRPCDASTAELTAGLSILTPFEMASAMATLSLAELRALHAGWTGNHSIFYGQCHAHFFYRVRYSNGEG